MNFRIHHVAVIGTDLEKSVRFYCGQLGLKEIRRTWRPQQKVWRVDIALDDGAQLELFIMPDPPARPSAPEACGLRHLAFAAGDIEASVAWLESRGVHCDPIGLDAATGGRYTFFYDPDGLPIELHE